MTILKILLSIQTDCFLLCYSIDNKLSYKNIHAKWIPELKNFSSKTPIILVGTKSDLRIEGSPEFVTEIEGETLKSMIGAKCFIECSAKTSENISRVFEEAVRISRMKNWRVFLNAL